MPDSKLPPNYAEDRIAAMMAVAKDAVKNKGVATRIAHTQSLDSVMSALHSRGSFASKASKLAMNLGKKALGTAPIPGIAVTAINKVLTGAESAIRGKHHAWRLKRAQQAKDVEGIVKFQFKDLSIDGLDRYRRKYKESLDAVNAAVSKYNNSQHYIDEHRVCDAIMQLMVALSQANRRHEKLADAITALEDVFHTARQWLDETSPKLVAIENSLTDDLVNAINKGGVQFTQKDNHEKCKCCMFLAPSASKRSFSSNIGTVANSGAFQKAVKIGNTLVGAPFDYLSLSTYKDNKFNAGFYSSTGAIDPSTLK